MRVHRRQFLIGPLPAAEAEDWIVHPLSPGVYLSYDPELPVHHGQDCLLLGVAFETDPDRPAIGEQLLAGAGSLRTGSWTGRWILIRGDMLELDATGTLGCLTRMVDGALWASSSPELLRTRAPALDPPADLLTHEKGMDWYPAPGSGIPGIRRLLPTQRLRLSDGGLETRPLLPPPPTERSYDELLDALERRLTTALRAVGSAGGVTFLPLSGGRDSRTVLAAAAAARLDLQAYTLALPDQERGDRELPPKLARAAGYEHRMIAAAQIDPERLARWDRHTGSHCVDVDRRFYACGQLDPVAGSGVDLGGGVFETGRCYYHGGLPDALPATADDTGELLLRAFRTSRPDDLREWARWLHSTHDPAIDWRDRFYVEQRAAAWLSTVAQGLDLAGVPRMHVANCADYLSETLAIGVDVRRAGYHHDHLVRRMAPGLAGFPFNPPASLRVRISRRVAHELDAYRSEPSPRQYLNARARRLAERRAARRLG